MIPAQKIMVALDTSDRSELSKLMTEMKGYDVWLKVGMELYYSLGESVILEAKEKGYSIFLDLKLCDIPHTVNKSLTALARLPIDMINVHAFGGKQMMVSAREAIEKFEKRPKLIAVTQLTSFSQAEMNLEQGVPGKLEDQVMKLANLAKESGLDGVVSSAWETQAIKKQCGDSFLCVTPGIRPLDGKLGDQKRVMTPIEAIGQGSDYLVIGRPITQADSPRLALEKILKGLT